MRAGNPFGSCPTFDLTASLQWSGCPTRTCDPDMPDCEPDPNCLLAPDIASNSWGGGQGSSAFWDVLGVLKGEHLLLDPELHLERVERLLVALVKHEGLISERLLGPYV